VVISNCGIVHAGHGKDWKHSASEPIIGMLSEEEEEEDSLHIFKVISSA